MTTMCLQDYSPPVPLNSHPNKIIRDAVTDHCKKLGLSYVQTQACLDVAKVAHSVEAGTKTADRIAEKMRTIRERFTHPQPPEVA